MENLITLDKLIEKLSQLEIGEYNNNKGIKINVAENDRCKWGSIKYNNKEISISSDAIEKGITIQIDENSYLYCNKKTSGSYTYNYIGVDKNKKHYTVYDTGISGDDIPYCHVGLANKLLYKVNENHYLEYNFNDNKINVYYRKYNVKPSENLEKDYVKFRYHDFFTSDIKSYNFKIASCIERIKEEFKTSIYDELVNSISIPELDCKNIYEEVTTLKSLADIYATYKDKFDLKQYEAELNEVYNFIVSITNDPIQTNINNIQNIVQNIDVTNKEELIRLRTEIDKVIELDKKTKKLRKKK